MDIPATLTPGHINNHLSCVITSFGENHVDVPHGSAYLVDARSLRNPPEDPAVRDRILASNGLDPFVRRYVMDTPGARERVDEAVDIVRILLERRNLDRWGKGQPLRMDVHVMCGGGKDRSPALAEEIAAGLRSYGIGCETDHPHITKPITGKPAA